MGDNFHYFLKGMEAILSYAWFCLKRILFGFGFLYLAAGFIVSMSVLLHPDPISENLKIMVFGLPAFVITLLFLAYFIFKAIGRLRGK